MNGKKQNELLHNTSCLLKINLWRLTVHLQKGISCPAHAQQPFLSILIDWSYPMTHVSSGNKKGAIFSSLLLALSYGVDNFFQEGRYIVTIFTLKSNLMHKSRPPGATSILPVFIGTISKCDLHISGYQHTKFRTCMKNRTVFAICHSPIRTY